MAPPTADRGDGEGRSVMIRTDIYKTSVPSEVINPVRIGARHFWIREVMSADLEGLLSRTPLPARVIVVPDQFLLFRIDRYDGPPLRQWKTINFTTRDIE